MAEPTTGGLTIAAATFFSLLFGSSMPSIDPEMLICAFAGGAIFVTQAPHLPIKHRFLYFFIAVLIGYVAAPWVSSISNVHSLGLVSFVLSAVIIFAILYVISKIKDGSFLDFFKRG